MQIDSRTGHHDAQIRTLHIVRNVFAFTEKTHPPAKPVVVT